MGLFTNAAPPDWCELRQFDIITLKLGDGCSVERRQLRERLLVTDGRFLLAAGDTTMVLRQGQFFDLPAEQDSLTVTASTATAEAIQLSGTWGDEIAGCGIWTIENTANPSDQGDPVSYAKHTRMDSHYHDYDEYWFILDGHATGVVSDEPYDLKAGDCLAIGTGHHHDLPDVQSTMRGAFFETTLLREKRLGHLWEHTHGKAVPDPVKI